MKLLHRAQGAGVGLLVAGAIVGGGYAAKQLTHSDAAALHTAYGDRFGQLQEGARQGAGAPLVPFLGPFAFNKRGVIQCGPAVRLMEGALRKVGVRKTKPANCVGDATRRQIRVFQASVHYKPTGTYNLVTHQALVRRKGYTNEARRDLLYLQHKRVVAKERATVLIVTSHAVLVGGCCLRYSQGSTRGIFPPWPRIPPATDCSGFSTWVAFQSGFGPAVGYYGSGSSVGWTGTLQYQGQLVRANGPLQVGDFVFYGRSPFSHVAVYVGHGRVVSHGSTGVKVLPYNYRPVGAVRRYIS